jgi:hypothetical protein
MAKTATMSTYDVKWRRPDDSEVLRCHGLTPAQVVFRIRAVIRMCGSVELVEVVPSGVTDDESRNQSE